MLQTSRKSQYQAVTKKITSLQHNRNDEGNNSASFISVNEEEFVLQSPICIMVFGSVPLIHQFCRGISNRRRRTVIWPNELYAARNGHLTNWTIWYTERTLDQLNNTPNGHLTKWTIHRTDTRPKGHYAELTLYTERTIRRTDACATI